MLNLVGAFLSVAVAATIASGIVDQTTITVPIIFAGLVGAIVWNVITWYMGIPSSSSHALVGGVIGSVLAAEGSAGVIWSGVGEKVLIPALIAPFVCGAAAFIATRLAYRLTRSLSDENSRRGLPQQPDPLELAGGAGPRHQRRPEDDGRDRADAGRRRRARRPTPGCRCGSRSPARVAVALGTFSGGWRVIRTLGTKVTDIAAPQGFSAETASSTTILASSFFGFSLSTTQVVSGGVMGAGLGRRHGFVHWSVVRRMVFAWILTMPAAALMGAGAEETVAAFPSDTAGVVVRRRHRRQRCWHSSSSSRGVTPSTRRT